MEAHKLSLRNFLQDWEIGKKLPHHYLLQGRMVDKNLLLKRPLIPGSRITTECSTKADIIVPLSLAYMACVETWKVAKVPLAEPFSSTEFIFPLLLQAPCEHRVEWLHRLTGSVQVVIFQNTKQRAVYHRLIKSLRNTAKFFLLILFLIVLPSKIILIL